MDVKINRAVPNIKSDRPAETRDFFVELLGFEAVMDRLALGSSPVREMRA